MNVFKVALSLMLVAGFVGCKCPTCGEKANPAETGVFIHITHGKEDAHRVLMAMNMASLMMPTQDVAVYFDIRGVDVVLKGAEDLKAGHFPSSHTLIRKLVEGGVPLMACPGCLKAAGKTPDDVMDGVQIASKEGFFNFTKGRILTLDY